jgi:ribosomal-protein-alanine N-acetyltransferase
MITFRQLEKSELAELATLDAGTNRSPWSLFNYQQSYNDDTHTILGIYEDSRLLLGACVYSQVLDESEILQICIRYEKQGNGHGQRLLSKVMDELREAGIGQLFLEVMVGNSTALKLYQKLGFNVIGNRKNYYHVNGKFIDALLMAVEL